jgi:hypothetical protein
MSEKLRAKIYYKETSLDDLPISIANIIRHETDLTYNQKQEAIQLIRKWLQYVERYDVASNDPYILRSHLESFASSVFPTENAEIGDRIVTTNLGEIVTPNGLTPAELIGNVTDPEILNDERVIVYGGVARTILKALATRDDNSLPVSFINSELPISDVDMMIVGDEEVGEIASHYGSDLSGTKLVQNPDEEIERYFSMVDVTMNQAIIYKNKLYYTEQALEDARNGLIRAQGSSNPLFGRDSVLLPTGEVYLLRGGFYRALSLLLRGRGAEVVVSQENIDAEKEKIGRYWLVLLFVKLLKMPDGESRDESVLQWHQVAKDIGSTKTSSPTEFLQELIEKFPDFSYGQKDNNFDTEAQTRWLISKLVHRGEELITDTKPSGDNLPAAYTPANITLRSYEGERDLKEFWKEVEEYTGENFESI